MGTALASKSPRSLTKCTCMGHDEAGSYMMAVMQCADNSVWELLWPARAPDLSPNAHVWDMMKRELTLSPQPATTIA